ncbi:MAG: hypothetical protein KGS47_13205 [Chloroflexi bacterium]|nr:hypothetical protein [Chloroflexota bacterium]
MRQLSPLVIGIIRPVAIFWSEHALRRVLAHGRFRASLLRISGALIPG